MFVGSAPRPPPVPRATLSTATLSGILVAGCTRLLLGPEPVFLDSGLIRKETIRIEENHTFPVGDIVVITHFIFSLAWRGR